jgi:nucleoside-diphosphate-sugar epimerase
MRILIFGLGYSASRIAAALAARGWEVISTGSAGTIGFDDAASVALALDGVTHILSSVPPVADGDPVLNAYGAVIRAARPRWIGYLSSTGVYGDTGGAWVDESAALNGRRGGRIEADLAWQELGAHVFRLPGIYGPGRSALERVAEGKAHRIDQPEQVFSRIHVDDIVSGVRAAFEAPPGVYNLADDLPCSQNRMIECASDLLGMDWPALQSLEEAGLSPMARAFYAENRRVANGKAKRVLGWAPIWPDYRAGLGALRATSMPAIVTTQPATARAVQ